MAIDLDKIFEEITKLKVVVIGDVMLDTYWWGNVDRISPEGPVPVVSVTKKEQRIGGAGNVALNVRAMGAEVILFSIMGEDEEGEQLKNLLLQNKIDVRSIIFSEKRMTTNKIRIIGRNQQMMRLDAEHNNDIDEEDEKNLLLKLEQYFLTEKPHAVILEDYNKGVLTAWVIAKVIELCKKYNIVSTADPKQKNFFAYKGINLFKPNLKEVKESFNILSDELNERMLSKVHQELVQKLHHSISLITLSDKGIFYQTETEVDLIPSHLRNIADVSGAGDTVIAVASVLYTVTKNIRLSAEIANIAGGIVCEEVGTAAIDKQKLYDQCLQLLPQGL